MSPLHSQALYLFVANLKMYFSYQESSRWATENLKNISELLHGKNISFVVCPSFEALTDVISKANHTQLFIGAQDCSSHALGAYTGQVAAQSLAELGCSYCIVGHSETRSNYKLNNSETAQKVKQLLEYNICPIICIGETKEEYESSQTIIILKKQLEPLIDIFKNKKTKPYIAYEPIWTVGTDKTPTHSHLKYVYKNLALFFSSFCIDPHFIYGGNVNQNNIQQIHEVTYIRGILVGRSSIDFQKIKTIVSLIKTD